MYYKDVDRLLWTFSTDIDSHLFNLKLLGPVNQLSDYNGRTGR